MPKRLAATPLETSAKRSGTGILPVVLQLFPNQLDRLEACPTSLPAFRRDFRWDSPEQAGRPSRLNYFKEQTWPCGHQNHFFTKPSPMITR